ncbi:hypothetical protein [Halothece sp. PCC 7418]|uniref:hypothetical protein n=1 Tax=Halothece sp. (strain PCC 7418) TaxID=65093 RepID=UPI0002F90B93|nr:hypothetical protein [Halothece sp. PCC 7418]
MIPLTSAVAMAQVFIGTGTNEFDLPSMPVYLADQAAALFTEGWSWCALGDFSRVVLQSVISCFLDFSLGLPNKLTSQLM